MNIVTVIKFLRNEFEVVGIKISGWGGRREGKQMERIRRGKEPNAISYYLMISEVNLYLIEGRFNCAWRLTK